MQVSRSQSLLVGLVLSQLGCPGMVRTEALDQSRLGQLCIREHVRAIACPGATDTEIGDACEQYLGDVRLGRVSWPGVAILSAVRGVLWLSLRTPEGTEEHSLIVVDEACDPVKLLRIEDSHRFLPGKAWELPPEKIVELGKFILGVSQTERAIATVLASVGPGEVRGEDLSSFGCETIQAGGFNDPGEEGLEGELGRLMARLPTVEVTLSSATTQLLCRFDDLDGSVQIVTVRFTEGRGVNIAFQKTGLRISEGRVEADDDVFWLW